MDPFFIMLLAVAIITVVAIRIAYVYLMSWKWSRMVMYYLDYKEAYYPLDYVRNRAEECFKIKMKWRCAADLTHWSWKAEDMYESKSNPRLWFEITDHWYDKFD